MMKENRVLTITEKEKLFEVLEVRFNNNMHRHQDLLWSDVYQKLMNYPKKMSSLFEMEQTGGEPDVINVNIRDNFYTFIDCSKETPIGRRNVCFDREALDARKEYKPANSAIDMANQMGIDILSEEEYRELQKIEKVDLKTSSWVKTPESIRNLGGALFCDRRYDKVFLYHNGASSYYGVRGFRGSLKV